MKTAAFTVRASEAQSVRWKQAAAADGHASVGTWLSEAADAYLKARARAGRPIPLAWSKAAFRVVLSGGEEVEVQGMVSRPFGLYRGTGARPGFRKLRTLVYLPSGQVIATLRTSRQCKALASELAPTWLRDPDLSAGIVVRHQRESQ